MISMKERFINTLSTLEYKERYTDEVKKAIALLQEKIYNNDFALNEEESDIILYALEGE